MQTILRIIFSLLCVTLSIHQVSAQQMDSLEMQNLRSRALTLDSVIRANPKMQTNSFEGGNGLQSTDSTSLPIGICKKVGETIFIICIDSARFTEKGATFDIYMAIDWPGTSHGKLAFAAKRVPFNPKGVMLSGGSEPIVLKLIGDQTLKLGPKNKIVFKGDGSNFISFDCEGYKEFSVNADIHFSKELIYTPSGGTVIANIHSTVKDLKNYVFQTSVTPFEVKGLNDFVFTVNSMAFDQSDSINPAGIVLPQTYSNVYPNINFWNGFYAQNLSVTLPKSFNRGANPTTIGVQGLIIDDIGVSGNFYAANIFTISEGDMSSWTYSLDSIQVKLEMNELIKGSFKGSVKVPDLNNANFGYRASMFRTNPSQDYQYDFAVMVNQAQTYQLPAFSSTLSLLPGSILNVHLANDKFTPTLKLNGKLNLDNPRAKLDQLAFQNLTFISTAPYITSGTFALTSTDTSKNSMGKLPISLTGLQLGINNSNVILGVDVLVSLGGNGPNAAFSAEAGFQLVTKKVLNPMTNRQDLVYDKVNVNDISLAINTQPFKLNGVISIRDDDPTFGQLFYGAIAFKINNDKIMPGWASVSAGFGKKNGNKYWYADAAVPVSIPMGAVMITHLFGGAQYGVKSTLTNVQKLDRAFNGAVNAPNTAISTPFLPDSTLGLGLNAGVAMVGATGESVFNAEAIFAIQFNASGGLANISLDGRSYFMTKRSDRNNSNSLMGFGLLSANYNHNARILDASLNVVLSSPNIVNGTTNLTLHIDTTDWYFWLNTPTQRAQLNVVNLFNANAYFMIGTKIAPMPAPPAYVTNLVSTSPIISTNMTQVSSGQGFATGMQISLGFDGEFPKTTKWRGYVNVGIGGGFDVTMFKLNPGTHCDGSSQIAGMNGWYCTGQVYTWLNGSLGARRYKDNLTEIDNEFSVCSINAAALLQGRLPKPSFVYGTIGFNVTLLGIIDFSFDADFQFGNDCTLI